MEHPLNINNFDKNSNKLEIKKIGIYINSKRDIGYLISSAFTKFFDTRGVDARLIGDENALEVRAINLPAASPSEVDCIVVLGGDGTLLGAARTAALSQTPVMGINVGRLGYLTDVGHGDAREALERLLAGEFILEKRIMLEADIGDGPALALNDACITCSGPPKPIMLRVSINGEQIDTWQGDGVLVSTPTGSTAYNLSAGGPIIKPDADILAVTPISPHALHIRTAVISASDVVSVRVLSAGGGALFMDGVKTMDIAGGKHVDIRRSIHYATIIKTHNKGFYSILRDKMKWS